MNQPALFIDNMNAALAEIVRALGGPKAVGCLLWPTKDPERAAEDVRACLNVHRAERFKPDHVFFLFRRAREAGFHAAKHWFDEATGYAPSEPLEPEDERAKLMRAFNESVALQAQIAARMERLSK